ncbi:MAG: hypothetical protein WBP64_05345 [Nitrososphaeraceae archaeon]
MKIVISAVAIIILMIGAQAVRAESEYDLGFKRRDANAHDHRIMWA